MRSLHWSRQFILALLVLATVFSCVPQAHAQAAAGNPFNPTSWAPSFTLRYIAMPAKAVLESIKQYVTLQNARNTLVITAALEGGAFLLTNSQNAPIQVTPEIGLAPSGYNTQGSPVTGTLSAYEDPKTKKPVVIIISNQTIEQAPNPDIADSQPPTLVNGLWSFSDAKYIYFTTDVLGKSGTSSPTVRYSDIPLPMSDFLFLYINSRLDTSRYSTWDPDTIQISSYCAGLASASGSAAGSNRYICYQAYPKSGGAAQWLVVVMSPQQSVKTCNKNLQYSTATGNCEWVPSGIDDGYCLVSPSSVLAKYVYNKNDPDCITVVSLGAMNMKPGSPGGNGAPPVYPSVSLTDPGSGAVLIQEAPAAVDSTAPLAKITTRVPDKVNNTTVENKTTISQGTQTDANPTAAPVQSGTEQNRYPGQNPSTAATGDPMQAVVVSNWPATLNVTGTVACSNCSQTAAPSQPVEVNFPDRMKIDGEVPAGAATDLPAIPSDLDAGSSSFLDPIRDKFAGFLNFQLPAHASSCPAMDISWHAWLLDLDVHSNYMCQMLEQFKPVLQGLMHFAYIAGAILILLGT